MMKSNTYKYPGGKTVKRTASASSGFTLVEMAVVLVIIGLTATMFLQVSSRMRDAQNRILVRTQLNVIDTALANFVAQNQRLPCPANGTIAPGNAGAGVEIGVCTVANEVNGVIPYVTLGLSLSNATDPWNGLFTYRVDPTLTIAPLMNMTYCDPVGTGPPTGGACSTPPGGGNQCVSSPALCTQPILFLQNKGLDVWNAAINQVNNRALGTGAAYVTISHGLNGAGAYNVFGNLQAGSGVVGTYELPNENHKILALPATPATAYQDAPLNDTQAAAVPPAVVTAHFDDYLSHPTILSVLNTANLGPRAN